MRKFTPAFFLILFASFLVNGSGVLRMNPQTEAIEPAHRTRSAGVEKFVLVVCARRFQQAIAGRTRTA